MNTFKLKPYQLSRWLAMQDFEEKWLTDEPARQFTVAAHSSGLWHAVRSYGTPTDNKCRCFEITELAGCYTSAESRVWANRICSLFPTGLEMCRDTVLKRITANVAVLIDSEKSAEEEELSEKRKALRRTCEDLGYKVHVTKLRATENYLTEQAIQAERGPTYRALGPYEDFKTLSPKWGKGDNWKIALQ